MTDVPPSLETEEALLEETDNGPKDGDGELPTQDFNPFPLEVE